MPEITIKNAVPVNATQFAPPTARSVKLRITIEPPSGAVLVYSSQTSEPVMFKGPVAILDVTYSDTLYVQPVSGAATWKVEGLGYEDNL